MAFRRRNDPDTVMLSGDPLDRARQALDVAREQILRGQEEAADYRVEDCLVEAEDAIDTARARTADAAEAEREAAKDSGAADRQRLAERPIYRPA
jgi:multidrug efflux pump subunit AcrA (membrane-fusion protein)